MLWCPKCKIDYREGVSVCADCGTLLVEEHELQTVVASGDEEKMAMLKQYLEYNELQYVKIFQDEELQAFSVSVQEKDREEAAEYADTFWKQQAMAEIESGQAEEWSPTHQYRDELGDNNGKVGKVVAGVFLALVALVAFLWYLQ